MGFLMFNSVDRAGDSSSVSLVKTFDSVLEAYEDFCKLKQVLYIKLSAFDSFSV